MGKFDGVLLVSDVDGTLFNSRHTISEANRDAIKYFKSEGGRFTVASGRTVNSVENYLDDLGINAPAILYNGALIYDFDSKSVLYEKTVEEYRKSALRKVADTQPQFGLEIYTKEKIYILRECFDTGRFKAKNYDVTYHMPEGIWEEPWSKALIVGHKDELDEFEKIYHKEYDSGYIVRSGEYYLDIVANGVSKGEGVKKLARHLGIERQNIYAVGDNMNDFEMLQYAARGYAVENASERLKQAAYEIVPSNDENAIAFIIQNLIKTKT